MRLNHSIDLTDKPNDAPAGELRPVFIFDGATHGAAMEPEARSMGILDEFKARFHRVRALPVPHTSPGCTSEGETSNCSKKTRACHDAFACTECGMPLANKPDAVGWVFEQTEHSSFPFGGHSLTCTSCLHGVFKFCPHFWVLARQETPPFVLRQIRSSSDYEIEADGKLAVAEHAPTFTYAEYQTYRAELLRAQRS